MNTFKKIAIALVALAGLSFGQTTTMSTTTLSAAVTTSTCSLTTYTVASTSTMQGLGTQNQPQTVIYVDKEFDYVNTVVDSTHITVNRCKGLGASAIPRTHLSGSTVWFSNATGAYPAPSLGFDNKALTDAEVSGTCTAANLLTVPLIYLYSGHKYDCLGGQWVETDAPGVPVLASATVTIPAGALTPTGTIMVTDTGTNAMTGINLPNGWSAGMCLTFVPGGAFTWTTAGNIAASGTAVANKTLLFCWSGTKWAASE